MVNIINKIVTYKELLNYIPQNDVLGIASYMSETRKKTFMNNPNLKDIEDCALYLSVVDDVPAGRLMLFSTRIKLDDTITSAESGSALEVHEEYRKYALGADLMMYWALKDEYDFIIASGISDMALPVYKKLKFHVFEFPRMMMLRNVRCILESKQLKGTFLKITTMLGNVVLKMFNMHGAIKSKLLAKKFEVKKETIVPEWVDDIVVNDGHKYMEVHNQQWLQWNLDYNFRGLEQDKQSFYSVWSEDKPVGFFMTKERHREFAGGSLKDVTIGSIVEWGTQNARIINEAELTTLALRTFSDSVDIVEMATADPVVLTKLKKLGFIKHGYAHIAIRDKKHRMPKDFGNPTFWRIRYGYADVILT